MELLEKKCQCSNLSDLLDVLILMMVDLHQMFPGIFLFGVLSFSLIAWLEKETGMLISKDGMHDCFSPAQPNATQNSEWAYS